MATPGPIGTSLPTVCICVPALDELDTAFCASLVALTSYVYQHTVVAHFWSKFVVGLQTHDARYRLAEQALAHRPTHLLLLDSDMVFPPDALARLLAHGQPIVACNYPSRTGAPHPTAVRWAPRAPDARWVYSRPESHGLEAVDAVGAGLMLIRSDVFDRVQRPWFLPQWNAEDRRWHGEDMGFCAHARQAGYEILIDHDLSKEVGHQGRLIYRHEHVQAPAVASATADVAAMLPGQGENRAARRQRASTAGR